LTAPASVPLLVPVNVEALVVNANDRRATKWSVSARTYAGKAELLPIEPPPFATGNDRPREGVTLHWLVPDGLTVGRWHDVANGTELRYPFVPDRWLVVRTCDVDHSLFTKSWLVESNHLGTDGTNPVPGEESDRLGRAVVPNTLSEESERTVGVTAAGPVIDGRMPDHDPSYAAVAAKVDNVLSFHDDLSDLTVAEPVVLSYVVVGWYDDPSSGDPMVDRTRLGRDLAALADGRLSLDDWRTVMRALAWSVGDDNDLRQAQLDATDDPREAPTIVPDHTICHGAVHGVRWLGTDGPAQRFTDGSDSAFAKMAIASRAGVPQPPGGSGGQWTRGFEDIDDPVDLGESSALRRPGAASGHRRLFPHVAVGTSASEATAALFEFLLGKEEGSSSPSDLATLFLALEHDMLDAYERPGGTAAITRRLHQQSFVPSPGGTRWDVRLRRVAGDPDGAAPDGRDLVRQLSALDDPVDVETPLRALDDAQRGLEVAEQELAASRRELYSVWWKHTRSGSTAATQTDAVQDTTTKAAAVRTREGERDVARVALETTLASQAVKDALAQVLAGQDGSADTELELVEVAAARYFAPADPVVVISGGRASSKHGGDGRFSEDGTLLVRFGRGRVGARGQTLRYGRPGLAIEPDDIIDWLVPWLQTVDRAPAAVGDLVAESLLLDPYRAADVFALSGSELGVEGPEYDFEDDLADLWDGPDEERYSVAAVTRAAGFAGVRPSPVAFEAWSQPWRPIHLAWRTTWYPSSTVESGSFADWSFDGDEYDWIGLSEFDHSNSVTLQGRCMLANSATVGLGSSLDAIYERAESAPADPQQKDADRIKRQEDLAALKAKLDRVRRRLGSADLMTQALSGFHAQLVQRDPDQFIEPDPPLEDSADRNLLGDADRAAPRPYGSTADTLFFPVRAGHARVRRLWLVDGFGQVFDLIHEQGLNEASYAPLRGKGLVTAGLSQRSDTQMLQFPPRLVQPSRLEFRFGDAEPVAGWLLPNHFDGSLMVYDGSGASLGALLLWRSSGTRQVRWEQAPGGAGGVTGTDVIGNQRLKAVVKALEAMNFEGFTGFIQAVDRTLWTTDPAGRRGDSTTVLVGRPIAVVGAHLAVELDGPTLLDQTWDKIGAPASGRQGDVPGLEAAVRLGLPDAREDGTLGYFLTGDDRFHSVLSKVDTASTAIVESDREFWPRAPIRVSGVADPAPKDITLLVDPRGTITASTGLQPAKTLQLPRSFVDGPLAKLDASFRVGPLLSGRSVRMPLPADIAGGWSWLEKSAVTITNNQLTETWSAPAEIEAAALSAHLNAPPTRLREGWLRLSQVVDRPQEGPTP